MEFRAKEKPDFLRAPKPNGYELMREAANLVQVQSPYEVTNELGSFVRGHEKMYELVEKGLDLQAETPAAHYDAKSLAMMNDLMAFKRLAQAMEVRARWAEERERWEDASVFYREIIEFGQLIEAGPLMNFMVGSAIEQMGIKPLERLIPKLSAEELKRAISELRNFNEGRISFEEVLRRERYFMTANSDNIFRLLKERFSKSFRNVTASSRKRYYNTAAYFEVVATKMAARTHGLEKKTNPETLDDLVPGFMNEKPIDPYTRKPLLLRGSASNVVVYSVGPNGKDELGAGDDVTGEHEDSTGYDMMIQTLEGMTE